MRIPTVGALSILLASGADGTAASDVIVRFDVRAHCEEIAGFGGTYSEQMFSFCMDEEQSSYNALKSAWASVPNSIRGHCTEIASFGTPGSYQMLKFCVDEELKSRRSNAGKEFEY